MPARPAKRAAVPVHRFLARRSPASSFFGLHLRKLRKIVRGLLPNFQPIEEGIRRFQPDAEPATDLYFFRALLSLHLAVTRNHFRAAFAQPRDVQNTLHGRVLAVHAELAHQFIQPHDADLGIFQRLEVQQILEFFFVLFLGLFLLVERHFLSRVFQHVRNVLRSSFTSLPMLGQEPPAQLVDLRRRPLLHLDLPGGLQDQRLFRFQMIVHRAAPPFCFAGFFFGLGGGGGGSAGRPASSRRYFTTFLLCSASVPLKKCPPCVLA